MIYDDDKDDVITGAIGGKRNWREPHKYESRIPSIRRSNYTFQRIYFVKHLDTGAIKIGRSNNPKRRLKELKRQFGGRMQLLGSMPGQVAETGLLRNLSKWALGKEWFSPSDQVVAVVETSLTQGLEQGWLLSEKFRFGDVDTA